MITCKFPTADQDNCQALFYLRSILFLPSNCFANTINGVGVFFHIQNFHRSEEQPGTRKTVRHAFSHPPVTTVRLFVVSCQILSSRHRHDWRVLCNLTICIITERVYGMWFLLSKAPPCRSMFALSSFA